MHSIAPVVAGLAVGIAFVVAFSVLAQNPMQYRMYGHSGAIPASWYFIENKIENTKFQNPEAAVKKGTAPEILADTLLTIVATSSIGTRSDEPGAVAIDESGVTFTMYHAKTGINDTIAVTIENNSPDDIAVFVLAMQGWISNKVPETGAVVEVGSVYRPVISDKYDVGKPPITSPYWILAGDSLTAYIQGELNAEQYSASMCYSYKLSRNSYNDNYCVRLPSTPVS